MILLETERLVLRNLIPADADIMFNYRNNEACARYQRGQTKDYDGIKKLIEAHRGDDINVESPFITAIALKTDGEMIGEIVVMPKEYTISMGYTVSYKYHKRGYAYEALKALTELLHDKYPDYGFICFTDPKNKASIGLLLKLGFYNNGYESDINSFSFCKWIKPNDEPEFYNLL